MIIFFMFLRTNKENPKIDFRLTTMPATHSRLIYRGFLPLTYILSYPINSFSVTI